MSERAAPGGPRDDGAPHVFVADVATPELADGDRHHLERVLRMRPGDPLTVGDGRGRWRAARFGDAIESTSEVVIVAVLEPTITVGFALVKGGRPELVVQKLTELGVDVIIPFVSERSVVRWDDRRAERNHQRLEKVAREAAMQSGRTWLPEVSVVMSFVDVAEHGAAMADSGGVPPSLDQPTLLIGPEGGWSPPERAVGLARVGLGTGVLRAETAAITAGALLTALRSGIVVQQTDGSPAPSQKRL